MPAAVELRCDFDAATLRTLAKRCRDAKQTRRLLSIAGIYEGMSRYEAAKIGGMDCQILRDWVLRFNDEGSEGLLENGLIGRFHAGDIVVVDGWCFSLIHAAKATVDCKSKPPRPLPLSGEDDLPVLCHDPMSGIYKAPLAIVWTA